MSEGAGLAATESSCWRGCQSVPLVPVPGRTAFQPCWRDCFQPNVWKAVGSFFLGCGLLVQPASSRGLVCTELLKQHDSLARTWLWGAVGQPGQASPSTPGAHLWDIAPELSIAVCKALGGGGPSKAPAESLCAGVSCKQVILSQHRLCC